MYRTGKHFAILATAKRLIEKGGTMPNPKQPVALLEYKGKSPLSKKRLAERKEKEVFAGDFDDDAPDYLNAEEKRLFYWYAERLVSIHIFSNIDAWTLAAYCKAFVQWKKIFRTIEKFKLDPLDPDSLHAYKTMCMEQNRWYAQCQSLGRDLGLNITARCKLVAPKLEEKPENKFKNFIG